MLEHTSFLGRESVNEPLAALARLAAERDFIGEDWSM
jgi:hypothetical protein